MPARITYPTSYDNALARLGKVGHNTRLVVGPIASSICLVYHNTAIVTLWGNGQVSVNNGGYQTSTTKARINGALQALGIGSLHQEKHEWVWAHNFYSREGKRETTYHHTAEDALFTFKVGDSVVLNASTYSTDISRIVWNNAKVVTP